MTTEQWIAVLTPWIGVFAAFLHSVFTRRMVKNGGKK